ncbi:hypothetical protein BDZ97DRAFT_1656732 [Flammula alnicola]|nr:hypothetical protein BDZ97DRAFT_1656732 [Flammula alnicola]
MDASPSQACPHRALSVDSSIHASQTGFQRPNAHQRASATVTTSSKAKQEDVSPSTFPAPLVLPGDDLSSDPTYPPQSLRQWVRLKERNAITPDKNVVYVAAPPEIDSEVEFMQAWTSPAPASKGVGAQVQNPEISDVVEYLTAYYHGISVKVLPPPRLKFTSWDSAAPASSKKSKPKVQKSAPRYVGLNTSSECVRIRTRACNDGLFVRQLNLDDLLDAAISILPEDAYALLLLVDHDLFESADDEFVCGRAYGGSRIAVISSARYNPTLDATQGIERDHAWPASHCEAYMQACCKAALIPPAKKRAKVTKGPEKKNDIPSSSLSTLERGTTISPLSAALSAHRSLPSLAESPAAAALNGLWMSRVCRTAAHELGHCFGMDHCIYYACSMQGSGTLKEDARQPPYLCPVDLEKMVTATGANVVERYEAISEFCSKHDGVHLFDSFRAWIGVRLRELRT